MPELTNNEKLLLAKAKIDSRVYGKVFYPGRFPLDFTWQHDLIFSAIDAKNPDGTPKHNKIVIKAGRGIGKTSIAKLICAKRLRFVESRLIGYIGKSHDFANLQTEAIKNGCLQNKLESYYFGPINAKEIDTSGANRVFAQKSWVTSTGSMVVPRGCQQPVRGFTFDWDGQTFRYDLIILDDLEDPLEVYSEVYRKKTKDYVLGDVVEAVPLPGVSKNWQIIYIDTLKHEDSTLQMLLDSDDWHTIDLAICDDNYKSLIPTFITDEDIEKKVEAHRQKGTLDVFYRESGLGAISRENPGFSQSYFQHYLESDNSFRDELDNGEVETIITGDPDKSANPGTADSCLMVWGINRLRDKYYVRDIVVESMQNDAFYGKVYELANQYTVRVFGLEVNSLNEYITYPLKNYLMKKGMYLEIIDLKPRIGTISGINRGEREHAKSYRAKALIPFYRRGAVFHNKTVAGLIETPLLSFPRPKKWDVIDAAAYLIQMLDKGEKWPMPDRKTPHMSEKEWQEALNKLPPMEPLNVRRVA